MKDIGRTNNGSCIVEMTTEEYNTFTQLERALNGEESDWYFSKGHRLQGIELSATLIVIREWTQGLFLINSLEHHINQLKDTFQATKGENE